MFKALLVSLFVSSRVSNIVSNVCKIVSSVTSYDYHLVSDKQYNNDHFSLSPIY